MLDMVKPLPSDERIGLSGVILAGGQNRRMGRSPKALLSYRHEKLVHRQIRKLRTVCSEVILVTNEPRLYLPILGSRVRIVTDFYPGQGPLAGIHAALSLARESKAWVVGCDMPFLSPRAALLMDKHKTATAADAVVPCIDGRPHPLHAIYDKNCAERIAIWLETGRLKANEFLESVRCEWITERTFLSEGIDPQFVLNVNTPNEYERSLLLDRQREEGLTVGSSDAAKRHNQ
ncbi:molybdenum cofactor guanylyltransferase [Cohnella fermenti]|uniref:Probable molybdenum cofactor guanylyltransferase n=1 Tax=Cohnella fermenti TaxID=2565925 RepID=A0A4S4BPS9_9BACL|nr:molybdenum cofactor guanylyltransferase [Cohnella fermenti]THF76072.1 molybdenum cofactor guanylyltransferase [Cohnella fermenti]